MGLCLFNDTRNSYTKIGIRSLASGMNEDNYDSLTLTGGRAFGLAEPWRFRRRLVRTQPWQLSKRISLPQGHRSFLPVLDIEYYYMRLWEKYRFCEIPHSYYVSNIIFCFFLMEHVVRLSMRNPQILDIACFSLKVVPCFCILHTPTSQQNFTLHILLICRKSLQTVERQ